jgi:hypothetical protein
VKLPRLRQVVLAATDLRATCAALQAALGVRAAFHDEGVGAFGLRNAVYAIGDTFVEVVSPVRADTAAGRQIARNGGDCGYMVMFEVADESALRRRLESLAIRVVHDSSHPDIVDVHLHPRDVGAAIVALDVCTPPGSWRWGGPDWTGRIPDHDHAAGLRSIEVAAADPRATGARWAAVLDVPATTDVMFAPLAGGVERIVSARISVGPDADLGPVTIAGVRFDRTRTEEMA